ncbi:hypothetical protein R1sor_019874 [Riccia sorocarpa]|uniref:NADH dehydrogenase [ubiquinone] 1 alpha subcomplex subunit 12 n=1 Tax=Riccia sorocarpa TaxID=122646 RepID=A0ABD3IDX3_9MARC
MIRRFVNRLLSYKDRVKVGSDKYGNSYYQKQDIKEGTVMERRWVEYKGEPDSTALPVEWTSWLAGTRKGAPTPEEIAALEAHRKNVRKMAALYEQKEEERRLKAKLAQKGIKTDDLTLENMEVMMRQISGGDFQEEAEGSRKEDTSHTKYTKVRDGKESTEPSVWHPRTSRVPKEAPKTPAPVVNPSSSVSPEEPQGQGDNFRPGTWRP